MLHRSPSHHFSSIVRVCVFVTACSAPAWAQTTTRASLANGGAEPNLGAFGSNGVSADGRFVLFDSASDNLVPGDTNNRIDVFVRDMLLETTELVSRDGTGALSFAGGNGVGITPDARHVLFWSTWPLAANDTNTFPDAYLRDLVLGTTELVTLSAAGNAVPLGGLPSAITPDARFVVFTGDDATLVAGDTNAFADAFVRDRVLGTTELVSLTTTGAQADQRSQARAITPDGRFVLFLSYATNLVPGDTNNRADLYLRDRQLALTERISLSTAGAEPVLSDVDPACSLSADGRYVAFASAAATLVPGDTNGVSDVFLRDRQSATTTRVSEAAFGVQADNNNFWPVLTADGTRLFFSSSATNLVAGDTNGAFDVFLRDLALGTVELVSRSSAGVQGNSSSQGAGVFCSPDGYFIAFQSTATNLVAGDTNGQPDVFVLDRLPTVPSFCFGDGSLADHTTPCPCGNDGASGHGCAHSFDADGAVLDATGFPAHDDVVLNSHATPVTSFTLFLQHDAAGDSVFHDGVICASGGLVRLRGRAAVAGEASFPNSAFAQDATTTLSQRGGVVIGSGARRYYSAWFRNASSTFCPPATANVTNGLVVDW